MPEQKLKICHTVLLFRQVWYSFYFPPLRHFFDKLRVLCFIRQIEPDWIELCSPSTLHFIFHFSFKAGPIFRARLRRGNILIFHPEDRYSNLKMVRFGSFRSLNYSNTSQSVQRPFISRWNAIFKSSLSCWIHFEILLQQLTKSMDNSKSASNKAIAVFDS